MSSTELDLFEQTQHPAKGTNKRKPAYYLLCVNWVVINGLRERCSNKRAILFANPDGIKANIYLTVCDNCLKNSDGRRIALLMDSYMYGRIKIHHLISGIEGIVAGSQPGQLSKRAYEKNRKQRVKRG